MSYYFNKAVGYSFDQAIEKITESLKEEGFGVLAEIDVKETLKKKLNVDFRNYRILGACNPAFAYKALQSEDKIGTLLPCNIIVRETEDNKIEVAAVNPVFSMQAVDNMELAKIANEVANKLKRAIERM